MHTVHELPNAGTIKFLSGPLAGNTFQINQSIITIGGKAENDIVISDQSISQWHARLVWQDESWRIQALSLMNALSVNQRRVQEASIRDNDVIILGADIAFLFLEGRPSGNLLDTSGALRTPRSKPISSILRPFPPYPKEVFTAPDEGNTSPLPILGLGIPVIEVSTNLHRPREIYPLTGNSLSIGRDASNDVVIDANIVSDFHAQIVRQGDLLLFVHPHPMRLRTDNGLFYKGQHIPGNEVFRKPLIRGDVFRISDENGTLVTLTFNDGSAGSQTVVPEFLPVSLKTPLVSIGRNPANTIIIDHPQISSYHACLIRDRDDYRILDQNSTNHVYVNGQYVTNYPLKPGDEVRIGPFPFTYTGTHLMPASENSGIRIDTLKLSKKVKKIGKKPEILLNDISLVIPAGTFVAVIGSSGTGKSTFMDAINGLRPAQQGTVLYNGQDYYRSRASFSTQLGYVPQDDIVHRDLTAERALYYAAKLRLPDDYTEAQIWQRVDDVLADVDMEDRRHLLIKKLSGGQRKRISIALELLAQPDVFFLDEPTSGLDSGLDRKIMFFLRRLADKGRTIILTTHATNNLDACDYICLLAPGGRLAYFGPPYRAKTYFGTSDFAEIYGLLEPTKEDSTIPMKAQERFKQSPDYQRYVAEFLKQGVVNHDHNYPKAKKSKNPKRGNLWKQFYLLSRRYIELLKNDVGNLLVLLLQAPVIALLLVLLLRFGIGTGLFSPSSAVQCPTTANILTTSGTIDIPTPPHRVVSIQCSRVQAFLERNPQGKQYAARRGGEQKALQDFIVSGPGADAQEVLFSMVFAAIMFGCINAVREIVKEAPIFRRERAVNLGIIPYLFSKIVVLGMLCLLQSAMLVLIVNAVAPFRQSIFLLPWLEVYISVALVSLVGMMLGLTISSIASNADRAMSFVPLILIPQVIFSGTIFPFKDQYLQIFALLFPSRWAMAALSSSSGLHSDKMRGDMLFPHDYAYHSVLFSTYSKHDAMMYLLLMWLALVGMILILNCLLVYFQKRK